MAWIFSEDSYTEDKQEIGWLREVQSRPSLLIRPLLVLVLLPICLFFTYHYVAHSPSTLADALRNLCIAAWAILKWPLIIVTVWGVNWLIVYLHIENDGGESFQATHSWILFALMGPYMLLISSGLGIRNPALGVLLLIAANTLMAIGIFHQLPESLQAPLWEFLHPHIPPLFIP